jgi:hypothetical protein
MKPTPTPRVRPTGKVHRAPAKPDPDEIPMPDEMPMPEEIPMPTVDE